MKRLALAVVVGVASAAGATLLCAVVLGVLNIYLTGHGIGWQSEPFNYRFISMSFLDLVLVVVVGTVFLVTSVLTFKASAGGPRATGAG